MAVANALDRQAAADTEMPVNPRTKYPRSNYRTASDLVREITYYSYSGTARFHTCEQRSGLTRATRKKGGKEESLQELQIKSLPTTSGPLLQTK